VDAIEDQSARIEAAFIGALAGESAAGTAAGAADLLGVAESVAATGGFDEADLRHRGLERPSRGGTAGLLLRALPYGLLTPLDRPRVRRDAYRCLALAGGDEATAITGVAAALLVADLLRFDLGTALVRVRQSLLEDAPMALLQRLAVLRDVPPPEEPEQAAPADGAPPFPADPTDVLQRALTAVDQDGSIDHILAAAEGAPAVALTLAGALAGARGGLAVVDGVDREHLPHADRAIAIAHRLGDRLYAREPESTA
jgi:hypothetical protein